MSFFDGQPHVVGPEPSFESFIDSDLILDTSSSPAPTPTTPMTKKDVKAKPTSLRALPPRLSVANGLPPVSPGPMSEFLSYSQSSNSSVTTPTTSNSSSLHNLNFDFFDGSDASTNSANQSISEALTSPHADESNLDSGSASARQMSLTPTVLDAMTATVPVFGPDAMADPTAIDTQMASSFTPAAQPFLRSVDDMGHQLGHSIHHHPAHHQRSLSLREVAPTLNALQPAFYPTSGPSPFTFASAVKMEPAVAPLAPSSHLIGASASNAGGEDDTNVDHSPPKGKKRRISGKTATKGEAGKGGGRSASGSAKKAGSTGRRKSVAGKEDKDASESSSSSSLPFDAASLIENRGLPTQSPERDVSVCNDDDDAASLEREVSGSVAASIFDEEGACGGDGSMTSVEGAQKKGTKRPPPSASQVTEAGMPFPVIDTSAKHSSLFVPPDTSGLTKREARLVKNRAAAFLSRQRKREQFEELEIKCRSLCRLVWKMWQLGHEAASGKKAAQKNSAYADLGKLSSVVQEHEGADVREILDTVLMLKGGSIAPTEDGQLQGAVAAGLKSANGKIIDDAGSAVNLPSSAAQAAEEASRTVAMLRSELDEHRKREAGLQAELAHERALRMKMEYDAKQREQEQRPFRNGGVNGNLSLTVPATFDDDDDDDDDEVEADMKNVRQGLDTDLPSNGRANGKSKRSRTSQRLQRQASNVGSSGAANGAGAPPNQRKAASAALMMVLFSFALFGMPGSKMGQNTMLGGISQAPGSSSNTFPLGRVLTAPVIGAIQAGDEDEELADLHTAQLPPSSHLSIDDLFPSMQQVQDLLRDAGETNDDAREDLHKSIQSALDGGSGGRNLHDERDNNKASAVDFSMDYKAFAKDLSSSLDWDMQRGFLVLGDGNTHSDEQSGKDGEREEYLSAEAGDAPTKLTLFVPAPRERSSSPEMDAGEDQFYDAPLATTAAGSVDGKMQNDDGQSASTPTSSSSLSQADATRAALQVLRNHRVAREAAAFAASRHISSPSVRTTSPSRSLACSLPLDAEKDVRCGIMDKGHRREKSDGGGGDDDDDDDEQDFSQEMQQSGTKTADQIRGTDFYQLEFSLSGAKVRNVAELTRLFGSMRSKRSDL